MRTDLALVSLAIPVWLYGLVNQWQMGKHRLPGAPRWALNPYATRYLTPQGLRYRRRALLAMDVFLVLVAIGLSPAVR